MHSDLLDLSRLDEEGCRHVFHASCILDHYHECGNSCPLCRQRFSGRSGELEFEFSGLFDSVANRFAIRRMTIKILRSQGRSEAFIFNHLLKQKLFTQPTASQPFIEARDNEEFSTIAPYQNAIWSDNGILVQRSTAIQKVFPDINSPLEIEYLLGRDDIPGMGKELQRVLKFLVAESYMDRRYPLNALSNINQSLMMGFPMWNSIITHIGVSQCLQATNLQILVAKARMFTDEPISDFLSGDVYVYAMIPQCVYISGRIIYGAVGCRHFFSENYPEIVAAANRYMIPLGLVHDLLFLGMFQSLLDLNGEPNDEQAVDFYKLLRLSNTPPRSWGPDGHVSRFVAESFARLSCRDVSYYTENQGRNIRECLLGDGDYECYRALVYSGENLRPVVMEPIGQGRDFQISIALRYFQRWMEGVQVAVVGRSIILELLSPEPITDQLIKKIAVYITDNSRDVFYSKDFHLLIQMFDTMGPKPSFTDWVSFCVIVDRAMMIESEFTTLKRKIIKDIFTQLAVKLRDDTNFLSAPASDFVRQLVLVFPKYRMIENKCLDAPLSQSLCISFVDSLIQIVETQTSLLTLMIFPVIGLFRSGLAHEKDPVRLCQTLMKSIPVSCRSNILRGIRKFASMSHPENFSILKIAAQDEYFTVKAELEQFFNDNYVDAMAAITSHNHLIIAQYYDNINYSVFYEEIRYLLISDENIGCWNDLSLLSLLDDNLNLQQYPRRAPEFEVLFKMRDALRKRVNTDELSLLLDSCTYIDANITLIIEQEALLKKTMSQIRSHEGYPAMYSKMLDNIYILKLYHTL